MITSMCNIVFVMRERKRGERKMTMEQLVSVFMNEFFFINNIFINEFIVDGVFVSKI